MATTYTKRLRAYFFTTVGDTQTNGFWTRFVGGGVSKPSESTMSDLVASAAFHTEVASAAQIDTVAALQDKQGLVIISSDASAKSGTNTALGSTGGKPVIQPSQLPTSESGTNDFTVTTVAADGANSATQDPFELIADATTTRNRYILKFKVAFVKWILRRTLPAGGTTGQAIVKTTGTDFDYTWGTVAAGGDSYKTTSVTSTTLNTTAKTFTVAAGLAYAKGVRVRTANSADDTQYLEGLVTSYSGTSLVFTPDVVKGTGTIASWNINLGGDEPQQIVEAVANLYVSQVEGSDTVGIGDGSINKPYATIAKGVSMAGNNQTVIIFAGSYTNSTNVVKNASIRYTLSFFPNVIITQTVVPFYDSESTANCARVDIYGEPNIISNSIGNYCFYVKQVCKLYIGKLDCQQAISIQSYTGNYAGDALAGEITVVKVREVNYYNTTPTTSYGIRFFGASGTFTYTPSGGSSTNVPAKNNSIDFSVYAINFVATANTAGVKFIQIVDPYSLFISNSYIYHGGSFSLSFPVIFDFTGGVAPNEVSVSNTSIRLGGLDVTSCTLFALNSMTLLKNFFKNIAVSLKPCTVFSGSGTQALNAEDIYLFTGSSAVSGSITIASGSEFSANGTSSAASTTSRIYLLNNSSNGLATIKN